MRRRARVIVALALLALAAWWTTGTRSTAQPGPAAGHRNLDGLRAALARSPARLLPSPPIAALWAGGVRISGHVIDLDRQQPAGGVEVVFRGILGETTTTSHADGSYALRVAPGLYRAFVRDDAVLSIGWRVAERVAERPSAASARVPDESLMTLVLARGDTDGVDLSVVRAAIVRGRVVDRAGRPIEGAAVRALEVQEFPGPLLRPALGTDTAETAPDGSFELRLPAGPYALDASHPRFAGIAGQERPQLELGPGERRSTTLTLTAGCVVSGRVVGPDGKPTGEGGIERQVGQRELGFVSAAPIAVDGTFRWAATEEAEVTLRAWPWRSPPSPARAFSCRDGARFDGVVFQLTDQRPDLEGVLVDQGGEPIANVFIDVIPLRQDGMTQQERTDAAGRWAVYALPADQYRVSATAPGRGLATAVVTSPRRGVRLELGGLGRLEGTTPRLASGSFELAIDDCVDYANHRVMFATGGLTIPMPEPRRLVTVTDGRFSVENLPACDLSFNAIWQGWKTHELVHIPSGGTAHVVLDVGPLHLKTIHGVVRDNHGGLVAGARVTTTYEVPGAHARPVVSSTTTDQAGRYTLKTRSGAELEAALGDASHSLRVRTAPVDAEQIDLVLYVFPVSEDSDRAPRMEEEREESD